MNEVGIAVVGLGRMGRVHALNAARLVPGARLVAVCDRDEALARKTAEDLGCTYYTELKDMLEQKSIDAVCVATPTGLHVEPVEVVVQAGTPLFCEKPLAGNLEDTLYLVKLIKESGIKCQVGFNKRFDPAYAEAKRLIRGGAIGKPVFMSGYARDPHPPPPWARDPSRGGGLFVDLLLHDFDAARFLMGDEVKVVYGDETNLVVDGGGVRRFADNVVVILHFRRGALATFHASMHAEYGYDSRSEVFGAAGNIMIGSLTSTEITLCDHTGISKPKTFRTEGDEPHFMIRYQEAYRRELVAFVDCLRNDTLPPVTEDDGLAAFRIALAAQKSAGEKAPVRVDN
ncbi:MAG: Gfo/Idh/MocA family oxidoreductase [Spirochaetia bacterium]